MGLVSLDKGLHAEALVEAKGKQGKFHNIMSNSSILQNFKVWIEKIIK
jgi:hypothetical protein